MPAQWTTTDRSCLRLRSDKEFANKIFESTRAILVLPQSFIAELLDLEANVSRSFESFGNLKHRGTEMYTAIVKRKRIRIPYFAATLLALAMTLGMPGARAVPILDANYTTAQSFYGLSLGDFGIPIAQTFTVLNTGILSSAAVKIEAVSGPNQAFGGGVTLMIVRTVGGLPSLSPIDVLGVSAMIDTALFPVEGQGTYSFINFFLPNIQVTAGQILAIEMVSTANGYFGVNGDLGDGLGPTGSYGGGQGLGALMSVVDGQFQQTGWAPPNGVGIPADFAFQTFVTPNTGGDIPEPSTCALFIAGIISVVDLIRRRRTI